MSARIIDEIKAFALPATAFGSPVYVVAERSGDNNTFNTITGKRSSRWCVMAIGDKCRCLEAACERSAGCVGGGQQLAKHKATEPEQYIRAWRKAIQAAAPVGPCSLIAFDGTDLTQPEKCQAWYEAFCKSAGQTWNAVKVC